MKQKLYQGIVLRPELELQWLSPEQIDLHTEERGLPAASYFKLGPVRPSLFLHPGDVSIAGPEDEVDAIAAGMRMVHYRHS